MALSDQYNRAAAETGFNAVIRNPKTNLPNGITITVCGTDSETFRKIQRKQLNRRLEQQQRSRNNKSNMTAEELESESLAVLVACTKSWSENGRPEIELDVDEWLPCTPENVLKVYEAHPWIKEQIDQEIAERNNFLPE